MDGYLHTLIPYTLDSVSRYSFIFFIGAILFINAVSFDLLVMILSSISVPINIGGKTAANLRSHRPLAAPIALPGKWNGISRFLVSVEVQLYICCFNLVYRSHRFLN